MKRPTILSSSMSQYFRVACVGLGFWLVVEGRNIGWAAAPSDASSVASLVQDQWPKLESLYRDLHAHPELSFHEEKTALRLTDELRELGLEITSKVGGFGFVALLKNGVGPTVLVRTDLDALPVQEQTDLPFASKVMTRDDQSNSVPVMHACGHDVHMTCLVGVARVLKQLPDRWRGTVVFIGQPAEERGQGAAKMLADGLFTRFPKPNLCLALHVNAEIPAGTVGLVEGWTMANVDSVDVLIRGVGGHGAWPHRTHDPVVLAAQTIVALQTIVSREKDPTDPGVITVGSVHGGTKHNIIPDEVKLQLTVRSFSEISRQTMLSGIGRIVRAQAVSAGIPEDRMPIVTVQNEFTPALYNDPKLVQTLRGVFGDWFGINRVLDRKPSLGGEDFSEYGRTADKIPVCMFWLGAVDPKLVAESERLGQSLPSLHSSRFRPLAEPTIQTGVAAMSAAVMGFLAPVPK